MCSSDLLCPKRGNDFLAVEVKGLKDERGSVSLTAKEPQTAKALANRFRLFVVKKFGATPFHEIYRAPLVRPLLFKQREQVVVQLTRVATV